MNWTKITCRAVLPALLGVTLLGATLLSTGAARAEELLVASSGGFAPALRILVAQFTQNTGVTVRLVYGPSMGATKDAMPARLARGEKIDLLIMVGSALDTLIAQGKVVADSRTPLAQSGVGVVVRAGAPNPDISTVDGLRAVLLAAKSIAYSDSASGVYIQDTMLPKLGIAQQVAGKAHMIPAEPVGNVVARGDAEIGFQQISELRPIKGITLLGPLPPPVQKYTVFSAGVLTASPHQKSAMALVRFLAAPAAASTITDTGMEMIPKP